MFTQARKRKEIEGEKLKVAQMRHKMYSKLIMYINVRIAQNLAQVLFLNKRDFTEVFLDPSISPQFELSV